jgi:hypothetical protein
MEKLDAAFAVLFVAPTSLAEAIGLCFARRHRAVARDMLRILPRNPCSDQPFMRS